jgi:MFS superfamily sulfate permease-like transporter
MSFMTAVKSCVLAAILVLLKYWCRNIPTFLFCTLFTCCSAAFQVYSALQHKKSDRGLSLRKHSISYAQSGSLWLQSAKNIRFHATLARKT